MTTSPATDTGLAIQRAADRRRVVFVNRYYAPDHSATAQILADLATRLASRGWDITVISSRQGYEDASANLPKREMLEGVDVIRVPSTRWGRSNLLGRAIDYVSFAFAAWRALGRVVRPGDILVAMTDPPMLSPLADRVARRRRALAVHWLQDFFPEVAISLRALSETSPLVRILTRLRRIAFGRAAAVVAVGELMRDRAIAVGAPADRTHTFANWADVQTIVPVPRESNPLRAQWALDGRFVVGYSGNLGRAHEFSGVLDAIEQLRDRADITFLFIGGGAQLKAVRSAIASRELRNVVLQPYQPKERLAESLCAADLHLVSLKPDLEGLVVPSKLYSALAVGRPVLFLGSASGEVARTLERAGAGITVEQDDGAAIARTIMEFADNVDRCTRMGARARVCAVEHCSANGAAVRWESLLVSLKEDVPQR